MGFKKSKSIAACLVFLGVMLFVLPSCEGPAGPAGKDGKTDTLVFRDTIVLKDTMIVKDTTIIITRDTTIRRDTTIILDTILMSPSCAVCHGNDQIIKSKEYQWAVSKHATGATFIEEGGNKSCIQCHNGAAFIFPLTKADSAAVLASPSNVNCRTCHKIHSKYDTTDWALTVSDTAQIPLVISPTTKVNFGKGNLCVTCHQTRSQPMVAVETAAVPANPATATGAFLNPTRDSVIFGGRAARLSAHYGSQTEIFFGKGAWLPDSGVGIPNTTGISKHVDGITDGCVTCHLGVNHTFEPSVSTCTPCHTATRFYTGTGYTAYDVDTIQTKVTALANELRDTLIARGIAKLDPAYPIGYSFNGAGKTFKKSVVGAYVNLQMIAWDGSKGVHNGAFTLYLLRESLKRVK